MRILSVFLLALFTSISTFAHLQEGSLKPEGGEIFEVGETMAIEWTANIAHDGRYDIYISYDGGETFPDEIVGPWQGSTKDGEKNVYLWELTEEAVTGQMRVRICQLYGGHCKEPGTYMLDSPQDFSVIMPVGVNDGLNKNSDDARMHLISTQNTLTISLNLPQDQNISIKAYDIKGHFVATIASGRQVSGDHQFTYSLDNLKHKGPLVFKLKQGLQDVSSQIWNGW